MSKWILTGLVSAALGFGLGWALVPAGRTGPGGGEPVNSGGSGSASPERAPFPEGLGYRPAFVDVTAACGIDFVHENGRSGAYQYPELMGAGVALFDHDGDGDLDVYLVNGNKLFGAGSPGITNRLYRNDGEWKFTDVTAAAGVGDSGYGQGACVGDFDGDGDLDLYVTNFGPNVLYRNRGDGVFEDISASSGTADTGWGQSCAFIDVDGDGRLDLYVQNYLSYENAPQPPVVTVLGKERVVDYPSPLGYRGSTDRLYRNLGEGRFEDVTESSGLLRPDGKGMGIGLADFDDDGYLDVFVANDSTDNFLFFGLPGGHFEEGGLAAGVAYSAEGIPEASMGVDVGDVNRDGKLDLIVPCLYRQVFTLYQNQGGRLFSDVSVAAGLAPATVDVTGFNANLLDHDADGDLDIFFTGGGVRRNETAPLDASYLVQYGMRDVLVANDGKGHFTDVSRFAGPYFAEARIGRGSAIGDLDGDGDLDIVVSNLADRVALLRNDTRGGESVLITLVTADGVENPFGADVRVTSRGIEQRKPMLTGVSYLSQSDRRLHFGLGDARTIERLTVRWPGGRVEEFTELASGRAWRLVEGQTPAEIGDFR